MSIALICVIVGYLLLYCNIHVDYVVGRSPGFCHGQTPFGQVLNNQVQGVQVAFQGEVHTGYGLFFAAQL